MRKVPIRWRVTGAFTVATAILLAAVGLFLYLRQEADLDHAIDNGLRSRIDEVAALAPASARGLRQSSAPSLIESDESFAQILTPGGRIVDSSGQLGARSALTRDELERARRGPTLLARGEVHGIEGPVRILATPVTTSSGRPLVALVGSSLGDRDEALSSLASLLLIGGVAALALLSLVGYLAIGSALRPVEAMRRRASEISAARREERLPVAPADDELRRLGLTLNAMLARVDATIHSQRQFVDDASHELRTPLALHRAELELALRHGGTESDYRAAIGAGLEETDRLISLAEALLVLARAEDGELGLAVERIPVAGLLAEIGARFRGRGAELARRVEIGSDHGLAVRGDRLRVEQALSNMIDNALRHGGGTVRIDSAREGARVRIGVTDEGQGFPPEFLPSAFDRFSRADEARSGGGSGLGLAIVVAIAVANGGKAGVGNTGSGAEAWIELPAA